MRNKAEIAFKVTGIEMHFFQNASDHRVLEATPGNLSRATEAFSAQCDGKENFGIGFVRFHILNEKNGEIGIAALSMDRTDMFLTVPAPVEFP